jgi:hypothetical protein
MNLRRHAFILLGILAVQYLLGMLANFYVSFPEGKGAGQEWDFAKNQILVTSHIIIGLLLLVGIVALMVRAIRANDRVWKISSGLAFGSVALAAVSGSDFITSQKDLSSLAMSIFFVTAVVSLAWGTYKSRPISAAGGRK